MGVRAIGATWQPDRKRTFPMGTTVDESYQLLAARYVRKQVKQLTGQLDGVRGGEDVEFIHRARVASRRLRCGLRLFRDCFGRRVVKGWRKEIRRLTNGLGDARDKDVQIEFVCDFLGRLEDRACYPGIARLLVQLEHQREALQPTVLKTVDRLASSPVPSEMNSITKALVSELSGRGVGVQSDAVFCMAEKHVLSKLEDLLGYEASLVDTEAEHEHHAMRIAAKGLRYTMEICKPAYAGQLDEFITATKRVQTLLGDLHDCDVWIEHLQALLEEERSRIERHYGHDGPLKRLKTGIDFLQEERRQQRQQAFEELVVYWRELQEQAVWERLTGMVQSFAAGSPVVPVKPPQPVIPSGHSAEHILPSQWHAREAREARQTAEPVARQPAERSLDQVN